LDYCLQAGSERIVDYYKSNLYIIKTLREFQYVDEHDKDQGANVRQKAKDVTNLLQDDSRLREARQQDNIRARFPNGDFEENSRDGPSALRRPQPTRNNEEDDDLKRALEASKQSFEVETAKQAEERDLAAAIKLSEEEEDARRKAAEEVSARALFDNKYEMFILESQF
jgi:epsin